MLIIKVFLINNFMSKKKLKMTTWHFLIAYFKWYVNLSKTLKYKICHSINLAFDAEVTENFLNGSTFYAVKLKLPALAVGGRPSRIRASLLFVFRSSYVA